MSTVIVIGGGASGIMAAITAAREGAKVILLEHNERIGKKILMTGNGKCNLSNLSFSVDKYYSDTPDFISAVIGQFGVQDTLSFFKGIGLLTKDKNGYVYPMSEQAASVLDVLRMELARRNVKIVTSCEVQKIEKADKASDRKFSIKTNQGIFQADALILACGGMANKQSGSDGSGYQLAKYMGHTIKTPLPALVQLRSKEGYFKAIAGVRCEAALELQIDGRTEATESGELQLTDYGISGIPVFQFSRLAAKALYIHKKVTVIIDFLPRISDTEIDKFLWNRSTEDVTVEEAMLGIMNKKLLAMLWKQNRIKAEMKLSQLSEKTRKQIIQDIKHWEVPIEATNPFANAQVSCGGVDCREVTEQLESRKQSGVFIVGELLDVDGICGGYNLQWAWTTGYVAGKAAAGRQNSK